MGTFPQGQIRCDEQPRRLIRTGKVDCRHLDAVRAIAVGCFEVVWAPQDYAYFLAHDHGLCLGVFSETGELTGFFLGLLVQGDLDVVSVATLPSYRRRGLGEQLVREAISAQGVRRAFLEVAVDNEAAIALYKKLGFSVTGIRRGYYEQKRDAYVMSRSPLDS